MTGEEILAQIKERKTDAYTFISWWRKEEDWLDFDLIDTFIENLDPAEHLDGFDLHTIDEMWEKLLIVAPGRIAKETRRGEEVIVWQKASDEEQVCPFSAQSVMTIFDVETHGDYLD